MKLLGFLTLALLISCNKPPKVEGDEYSLVEFAAKLEEAELKEKTLPTPDN